MNREGNWAARRYDKWIFDAFRNINWGTKEGRGLK
jgi:hypothetical protein